MYTFRFIFFPRPVFFVSSYFIRFLLRLRFFKRKEKKTAFEINLVTKTEDGLVLKPMNIKKTLLNLGLYYEDDFIETDRVIQKRLGRKKDKGIVLLHGLPGTGKTTYLRYMVGRLKKKVIFLSPAIAEHMLNSGFMDLLIDNPDSVLVIEDAERLFTIPVDV